MVYFAFLAQTSGSGSVAVTPSVGLTVIQLGLSVLPPFYISHVIIPIGFSQSVL